MVTFLTTAKNFAGRMRDIQTAALTNWRSVCPGAEIVVFGEGEGLEACCQMQGALHVRNIRSADSGLPFFEGMAEWARAHARYEVQVYANADILFPPDLAHYLRRVPEGPFLMVGQRVDLREAAHLRADDFYDSLGVALQVGDAEVHRPSGMDYFVFRRGMWLNLKPLIVGRGGYDSALVVYCLRNGIPLIDASFAFPVVHQGHDYSHVRGGKASAHYGAEAQHNFTLHGLRELCPNCVDAESMMLRSGEIVGNRRRALLRRLEVELYYRRGWRACPAFNRLWSLMTRGGKLTRNPTWQSGAKA